MENHLKNSVDSIDVIVGVYIHWEVKNVLKGFDRNAGMSLSLLCLPFTPWKKNLSIERCSSVLLTEEGSTCACCCFFVLVAFIDFLLMKIQWRFPVLLFIYQYWLDALSAVATFFISFGQKSIKITPEKYFRPLKKHRVDIKSEIYMKSFKFVLNVFSSEIKTKLLKTVADNFINKFPVWFAR